MNKEQFFYKPKTAKEILELKERKHASENIAEKVLELGGNEALIIPEIVPEDYESRMKFLKRAPQVVLDTGKACFDAVRFRRTPLEARREAFGKLDKNEKYCGYVWKSLRKNEHKRVSLVECIEGAKLFAWSEIANAEIKVKPYNDTRDVGYFGGKFKISISSRTEKQPRYNITLESVPLEKSKHNPVIWTDLTATHSCGIADNDFSYRYISSEDFCAHTIASYLKIAQKRKYERDSLVPLEFVPFALPSELTADYYSKLTNQMMVEYEYEGKKRKRALNKAEKEILLWDLVKMTGHDAAFYATKKFTDYSWKKAA